MDNLSKAPSSTTEEIDWDEYIKQESEVNDLHEDYKMIAYDQKYCFDENNFEKENCDIENFIAKTEEDVNKTTELKRKHKSNKILACEFCERESIKYIKSKINGKSLCNACYQYKYNHGHLIPPDKRGKNVHKNILVCEFCQQESTQYTKSKMSDKSLCNACYQYERKNGHLIPTGEREKRAIHNILGCEFCQKESKEYARGKISGKSLCNACYQYERKNGHLIPKDQRNNLKSGKHKDILVCEFCQKESKHYKKGKFNDKSLCYACYQYERKHGHLIPKDQRIRNKLRKHKDSNNQLNRLIGTELSQNENEGKIQEKTINPTHFTKKQNKDTQIRYDDD